MTEVRIGSKECPIEELLEVLKSEDIERIKLGEFSVISQWEDFARCLDLPHDLLDNFIARIQQGNKQRYDAIKFILVYWSKHNSDKARMGIILSIVVQNLNWGTVTDFLRNKIKSHAKSFHELDEDSKARLLNLQFIFLGRPTCLKTLQGFVSEKAFEDILNTVDNNFIVDVLKGNLRQFDKFKLPPLSPHYINRNVEVKRKLSSKILEKSCEDIFVFDDKLPKNLDLSILVRPNPADVSGGQLKSLTVRFILLEEEEHFLQIVKKTEKPVHRIKYHENSYFWISTTGSTRVIRKYLVDDVEEINEDAIVHESNLDSYSNTLAICGGSGTGKSELLTSLANKIFQRNFERYVIFLNFPTLIQQQAFPDIIYESTDKTELLAELFGSIFTMNSFAKTILEGILQNLTMRFEIFLDRIDEVPFEQLYLAKRFLKMLDQKSNIRVHLAISPAIRHELEDRSQIKSYDIMPFRKDDLQFLVSKMVKFRLCQLVLKSLDLIRKNNNLHQATAGSPLQCYMLAKVYSKSTSKTFDLSGELCWSKSPIKSITELYRRYMEIQFQQMGNPDIKLVKLMFYREAFKKLFRGNTNVECILQALDEQINQCAMTSLPCDDLIEHKTFSEYLVAEFIVGNWTETNILDKTTLYNFVYKTLLVTCKIEQNRESAETFNDLENDTLESVLLEMGTKNTNGNNTALTHLAKLGWGLTMKRLQTSVVKGQLGFRHSAICYFLNDIFSIDESLTHSSYAQPILTVCSNSHNQFDLISKDFLSKLLVSVGFSYKHLFRLTTELFRESYVDILTCETILVLAARQNDVRTFSFFRKIVEVSGNTNLSSMTFFCATLKDMIYEHTPLHEAAKRGNYVLFEHLFDIYRNKMNSLTGLVQICLSDSSENCKTVIKNKSKILRLLSSENIKYQFKNIECSLLDGVHVTLFTKVCDMVGYTLSGKDVKWLYKFVVYYFTNVDQMDIFVNWLISKGLARLLLYVEEGHNHLVIDALKQNVLGPQSLENIYNAHCFDLGSIMYYVQTSKSRHALVKKMIDLVGNISLDYKNDPIIFQWAESVYDCDPMKLVHFERSDRANVVERLTSHKLEQVKIIAAEIHKIIEESKLIKTNEQIGQIQYNLNDILGQGSFGIVYSGTLNERHVAVKKINYTPEQQERVEQETQLLRECDGHENIVKCFFVEKSPTIVLIALEICNFTLEQFIKSHHLTMTDVQVRQILHETTKGIAFLHGKNVVHFDITPQNILLAQISDENIRVKISDFGNSRKLTDKTNTKLEVGSGTIEWMAPEVLKLALAKNQSNSHSLSISADIFSLGCLFYYVLSNGIHPFGDKPTEIKSNIELNNPCVRISHFKDPSWIHLFYLMISQKPDARPTAAAILKHPIFWSEKTMLTFLVAVSNATDQPTVTSEISKIMNTIENYPLLKPYYYYEAKGWTRFLCQDVQAYVSGIGCKRKPYHGDLFFDLVRAIRNMQAHFIALPKNVQTGVGEVPNNFMKYWLKRFAIVFQIIWLNFEVLKKDSSTGLLEYYCKEYDFNCEEVSVLADEILAKYIKKQCAQMILKGNTF